ncbi:PaaI family thioesterase [Rhodothermus profundi]|uniref:Uncharacterized domain 1-containing protein n=1 Tax=Rhodothermus profundi TaxID=633813 RepID=A0A1M6TJC4_9BACT|nr:PaaI family thioesterase [Rhodothermus profundi]SHK56858.1 uncharacterized domain 1-containing protein [Rhodothermus profundi]
MDPEAHFRKLERMYQQAPINAYFQPQLHVSERQATLTIPIRPEFFHAASAVHGAVYFKALDDVTFFAAQSVETRFFIVTVSFTLYFLRPVTSGVLKARGRLVHHAPRLLVAEGELYDERNRLIGRGSGTFMPSKILLSSEIGYQ